MFGTQFGVPGQSALFASETNEFLWGGDSSKIMVLTIGQMVDGTARDAGALTAGTLRSGLVMGRITATNKLAQYDPTASDGTQVPSGILGVESVTINPLTGSNQDAIAPLVVWAPIKAANVYVLGVSLVGSPYEYLARKHLAGLGFKFDDDLGGYLSGSVQRITTKATNYTVLPADNGTLFQQITADAIFTLPAIKAGLKFSFLQTADFEIVVASAEGDNMVVGNDLSADSITFTTAGQQIGAQITVEAMYVNGTVRWVATLPYSPFGTGLATMAFAIAT